VFAANPVCPAKAFLKAPLAVFTTIEVKLAVSLYFAQTILPAAKVLSALISQSEEAWISAAFGSEKVEELSVGLSATPVAPFAGRVILGVE